MTAVPEAFDAGVASQIGHYADAVRVPCGHDLIVVSGTPGLAQDGSLPEGITRQATQAWQNVERILAKAGAGLGDVVNVRQWLVSADDVPGYVGVRSKFITHKPTYMLAVIDQNIRADFLVEIEVMAAVRAQ